MPRRTKHEYSPPPDWPRGLCTDCGLPAGGSVHYSEAESWGRAATDFIENDDTGGAVAILDAQEQAADALRESFGLSETAAMIEALDSGHKEEVSQ